MEWIEREGTQEERPADVDTTSSPETVYLRRNQTRVEETDADGVKTAKWTYEEAEMSRDEYNSQQNELSSPLAKAIMQANTELIAQNELLQIQVEMLMEMIAPIPAATEGE